jgi:hypothetical protein
MAKRVATVTSYGPDRDNVQLMTVTVHRGNRVIMSRAFPCGQYPSQRETNRGRG